MLLSPPVPVSDVPSPRQETSAGAGILVFAHTPPPHHGQSAMVQLLLDRIPPRDAGDPAGALRLFHVNARLSRDAVDVGGFRPGKIPALLKHCRTARRLARRHGLRTFYYVPAPPARVPLWRDWVVMTLCRPVFPRMILHWHAGGLARWLEQRALPAERWLSRRLLSNHALSLVLRPYHRRDAEYLAARRIEVVPNGLPDPCPDFDRAILPRRQAAADARRRAGRLRTEAAEAATVVRVLYLSLVRPEKGIFDALEAIARANARLRSVSVRVELTVAGDFDSAQTQTEFARRLAAPDLAGSPPVVHYAGYVAGAAKDRLLREADCLCFPSRLPEGFPLTLAEAMAYGLPIITSDHCELPEILPPQYPGVFRAGDPADLAARLVDFTRSDYDPRLRSWFLEHYTVEQWVQRMRAALSSV